MIAADPYQGGATWAVLQYLLGLRRLGHRVCFVEPMKPNSSVTFTSGKPAKKWYRVRYLAIRSPPGPV